MLLNRKCLQKVSFTFTSFCSLDVLMLHQWAFLWTTNGCNAYFCLSFIFIFEFCRVVSHAFWEKPKCCISVLREVMMMTREKSSCPLTQSLLLWITNDSLHCFFDSSMTSQDEDVVVLTWLSVENQHNMILFLWFFSRKKNNDVMLTYSQTLESLNWNNCLICPSSFLTSIFLLMSCHVGHECISF